MSTYVSTNHSKQSEILKKRLAMMILKENSRGLDSYETLIKRAAIRELSVIHHQTHK